MTRNGNAITPAKRFTTKGVHVGRLKEMLHNTPQGQHTMGWHPSSMHTSYCATGASGGIDPDRTFLEDYSPAQMVVDLQAGSIDGVGNLGTSGAQLKGLALPWLRI